MRRVANTERNGYGELTADDSESADGTRIKFMPFLSAFSEISAVKIRRKDEHRYRN